MCMGLFGASIGRGPGGNVSHGPRGFPGGRINGFSGRGRRDAKPDAPSAPQHGAKQPTMCGWGVGVPGRGGHTPVPGPPGGRKPPIQSRVAAGTWPQKALSTSRCQKKVSSTRPLPAACFPALMPDGQIFGEEVLCMSLVTCPGAIARWAALWRFPANKWRSLHRRKRRSFPNMHLSARGIWQWRLWKAASADVALRCWIHLTVVSCHFLMSSDSHFLLRSSSSCFSVSFCSRFFNCFSEISRFDFTVVVVPCCVVSCFLRGLVSISVLFPLLFMLFCANSTF